MPRTRKLSATPLLHIREWRKHARLTQEQLEGRIEKAYGTVSKLESGKINFTQEHLEALAEAFNCTVAELFSPPPSPDRPEDDLTRHLRKLKTREDRARAARILAAAFGQEDVG